MMHLSDKELSALGRLPAWMDRILRLVGNNAGPDHSARFGNRCSRLPKLSRIVDLKYEMSVPTIASYLSEFVC